MKDNTILKIRWNIIRIGVVVIGLYLIVGLVWLQVVNGRQNAEFAVEKSVRQLPIPATRGVIYDRDGDVLVNSVSSYVITIAHLSKEENMAIIDNLAPVLIEEKILEEFEKAYTSDDVGDLFADKTREENYQIFYNENYDAIFAELHAALVEVVEEHSTYRRYQPVRIAPLAGRTINHVTPEIIAQIEGMRVDLPNVMIEIQPERQYKIGDFAFHLLGGINPIDREGREGLEKSYDDYLRGEDGMRLVEVNAYGRPTSELGVVSPVQGADLRLTIDLDLQVVAEQALLDSMAATRSKLINAAKSKGRAIPATEDLPYSGSVVVLDVNNGAILAMASLPQVDRDNYAAVWNVDDPFISRFKPGTNWATGSARPPGSVVKPILGIAGIETGVIDENTTIYCYGVYKGLYEVWNRQYWRYCWDRSGHGGPLDLPLALKNSCNLYFYPLGEKLGLDNISEYYHKFGLGDRVEFEDMQYSTVDEDGVESIGYATSMSKGTVVDDARYEEIYGSVARGGVLAQAGIGQGDVRVNPLQIALYTAMLANAEKQEDGNYLATRWNPYVVDMVQSIDGEVLYSAQKDVADQIEIDAMALELTREGMRKVTEEYGGTDGNVGTAYYQFHKNYGSQGYLPVLPFEVAGKTGTAQESGWEDHGWFISYAPYDDPQIAVAVLMEQGQSGGTTGGPVALAIYEEYFADEVAAYRANSETIK